MVSAAALLAWYDRHRRILPWRCEPGEVADPYRVWLSEIMLQQTTVAAVIPYFERFLARFPTVEALAQADANEVMAAWAGLGYYARARNLHACARAVTRLSGFPTTLDGLRALPGIGPYTASAIGAIAFGLPTVPVDGNVERVVARVFSIALPPPGAKRAFAAAAARLGEDAAAVARPSDFAQALFDLGATICTPKSPACAICPWRDRCDGREAAESLPVKAPRRARPIRHGIHYALFDHADRILLRRRSERGLFGGMAELPGTEWTDARPVPGDGAPASASWQFSGQVTHELTHFQLNIDVLAARLPIIEADGFLRPADQLHDEALASVMRKCISLAQSWLAAEKSRSP